MALSRLIHRVLRFDVKRPRMTHGLCQPDELEHAIQRERSRADRTSGEFAAVIFAEDKPRADPYIFDPLIQYLQSRSRAIDELGWSYDNKLWLILPNCSQQAAANIAAALCEKFSSDIALIYTLYHYKSDSSSGGNRRSSGGLGIAVPDSNRNDANSHPSLFPAIDSRNEAQETGTAHQENAAWQAAIPMEKLFERHMPWWKRALDVTLAAIALILLAPVFALIAIAIKVTSPGPVLFTQTRSGRAGRPFKMYKFRSMIANAEAQKRNLLAFNEQDGPAFKMENDPRVTTIGRFLRASSIDEMPQLWNVLRGDMSLVGPRPLPIAESEACENWQRQRLDVTPGLTCFWQIKDRRAKIPFVDWARMDIRYAGERSLYLDLCLIAQTVLFILRRKGV